MSEVPAHLQDRWPCFLLYHAKRATWTELDSTMSMTDVLDAIDALDYLNRQRPPSDDEAFGGDE